MTKLDQKKSTEFCLANAKIALCTSAESSEKYKPSTTGLVVEKEFYPLNYVLISMDAKNKSQCYFQKIQIQNERQKNKLLVCVHLFANVIYADDFVPHPSFQPCYILDLAQLSELSRIK
jgi:hypothetical protein